ncbi:type IV pilus modification protein PilV [Corallincola spongiicola]|uniref:Type IV pilus modification protein PilV n=1 Tax=Corallincola spongiicola TaxID=2520508 RepID=A0ABY1WM38_9GAMM|nr:type IV pilus modification protein PilV [Corallincola spongiicola]
MESVLHFVARYGDKAVNIRIMNKRMHYSKQKASGFSLIELMVAVIIVSIGVLGVVAMQGASIGSALDASQRSTAAALSAQIVESMRANATQLNSYNNAVVGNGSYLSPSSDCGAVGATCSPAEMVSWDLSVWERAVMGKDTASGGESAGGLVDGKGCILVDSGTVTVILAWRGGVETSDAADSSKFTSCGTDNDYRRQQVIETFVTI